MCGIAGLIDLAASTPLAVLEKQARDMAEVMKLRGPDDKGVWADPGAGVALSQARLSIVDLSAAGHQPMVSSNGRYVITYNGEVYNAAGLRQELGARAPEWRGHSDTEVMLEAMAVWGVRATLERLIGMFALAVWDREERKLTLARDRFGIKPLYWGCRDGVFLFGSELKPLMTHTGWTRAIDKDALAAYLRFNYVPAPHSIFEGVSKLQPGHMLEFGADEQARIEQYWSLRELGSHGTRTPVELSDQEAEDRLDDLIRDSVKRRMIADVPVGAFLSGGIDSSTVVAAMQAESDRPAHTFSIGFEDEKYNEAQHAKEIARHLGTEHEELYVASQEARDQIPQLSHWYDEPFADSSQIPTFLVSRLARQSVTVALSGDGGDELFCGYNRYTWGDMLWRRFGAWPGFAKHVAAGGIRSISPDGWDNLSRALPKSMRPRNLGIKAHKVADVLSLKDEAALYRRLVSVWDDPAQLVPGSREPGGLLWDSSLAQDVPPLMERMQLLDALTYLPDDILTKVDRASMAVSLEARVPLLDHRIAEFAVQLPRRMRVRDGKNKWLLRQVLSRYVPTSLYERPKMGFGIPLADWLRGPLRDWAEHLLTPANIEAGGLLSSGPILAVWQEHLSGRVNREVHLWTVLMFLAWRERWETEHQFICEAA